MTSVQTLLSQAQNQMASLSQSAEAAKAQVLEYEKQQQLMENYLLELKQAVMLASAPEGIAMVSGGHLQAAAVSNVFMTAGQRIEMGAGSHIALAASQIISLFTENEGIESIAAKGDLVTQAQSGNISTVAKNTISVTSTSADISLTAAKTLTLNCAGGAYIRLSGENIELGCPGDITLKQSKLRYSGPASLKSTIPELPESGPQSASFMLLDAMGDAAPPAMVVSLFDSEARSNLWTSSFSNGETSEFEQPDNTNFYAIIGADKWTSLFSDSNINADGGLSENITEDSEHGPQFDSESNGNEES